jgi:hypothetical protein
MPCIIWLIQNWGKQCIVKEQVNQNAMQWVGDLFLLWDPIQRECKNVFSLPSLAWALMFYELPPWLNLQCELLIVPFFKRKWNTPKKLSNQCKIVENCDVPVTLEWSAAWKLSRKKTQETITPFHSYYDGISTMTGSFKLHNNQLFKPRRAVCPVRQPERRREDDWVKRTGS